jgi:hypothetical protein
MLCLVHVKNYALCMYTDIYLSFLYRVSVMNDRLCGLVVRVPGYRYGGPGSIPGATVFSESSGSGTGSTQPREYN